jgi:pyruvate kinase
MLPRTKIIATLGPAVDSDERLAALLKAGVNIVRLNLAHGTHAEHADRLWRARRIAKRLNVPVGALLDLPGPKLRVGKLIPSPMDLKRDETVTLIAGTHARHEREIPISYPRIATDLKPGQAVYIADGLIRLVVISIRFNQVKCRVANGGTIRTGNGVNMPFSQLRLKAFTREDERHLEFGIKNDIDFVGISFVGEAQELRRVRAFCKRRGASPALVAKIERRSALDNLPEILQEADALMVARGDLGVEVSFSEIPGLQRKIVMESRRAGKPVIVATQVLESMVQNPRPTRAEATDIANAIREGADAVMLSGETSIGKYPLESAQALAQVAYATEQDESGGPYITPVELNLSDAIALEACRLAERINAAFIVVPSRSGGTAARVSRFRPRVPLLALVHDENMRRRFTLYWGIETQYIPGKVDYHTAHTLVKNHLLRNRRARAGAVAVMVSGSPAMPRRQTGMIQLIKL